MASSLSLFIPLIMISPAPLVSNPTPTPNMDASIKKQNGFAISSLIVDVDTNAQLFRAA